MVIDGLKLRMSAAAHPGAALVSPAILSIAGRRHTGAVFLMPMASDLSYLHLRRLPVLRIFGHIVLQAFTPGDGDHEGIVCHAWTRPNRHRLMDFLIPKLVTLTT
jgi:hypothetical protein